MTEPIVTTVALTEAELRLVEHALHAYLNDFGHDESDVIDRTRAVLAKLSSGSAGRVAQAAG
jgi:hypothetical protein